MTGQPGISRAWPTISKRHAPGVTMRSHQQRLRALVTDIIADIDESTREVILTVHWRGGQHSQLRVRKPKSGEHGCRTPEEALADGRRSCLARASEGADQPRAGSTRAPSPADRGGGSCARC